MKLQSPKRILSEDFSSDDKAVAGTLGGILNTYLEELYTLSSKNITIEDNLNQELKTLKIQVDASGFPKTKTSFQNNLKGKITGMMVIRSFGDVSVTAAPFIEFSESTRIITINKVIGLVADTDYQLVIQIIAS